MDGLSRIEAKLAGIESSEQERRKQPEQHDGKRTQAMRAPPE